jgi:acyl carrier protein
MEEFEKIKQNIKEILLNEFDVIIKNDNDIIKKQTSSIQFVSFILFLEDFYNIAISNSDNHSIEKMAIEIQQELLNK